jgi:hypothetical protein
MKQFDTSDRVINHYEPASVSRTVFGVLASLFSMGLPIGLTEMLRAGGDGKVAIIALICAALAAVFAFLSIRGTLTE